MIERPSTAIALLFVAGTLILFLGIEVSGFTCVMSPYSARMSETSFIILWNALICGIAVLTAGILLCALPKYNVIFGTLGVIFSVFSIFSAGGLGIGMIFSMVGGASATDWKSAYPPTSLRYINF